MPEYNRVDISEEININKVKFSKIIGTLKILALNMNRNIGFAMVVMV